MSPQSNSVEMNQMGNGVSPAAAAEETAIPVSPMQQPPPPSQEQHMGWARNKHDTLLVVATLITGLTYQVGTNLPGGYYQNDGDDDDGFGRYAAGDPIMRHKQRKRYWLFMTASWVGFANSMLMTVSLLTGVSVKSRLVSWPFTVAYSSLVLTFISSQPKTNLVMDILIWILVLFFLLAFMNIKSCQARYRAAVHRIKGCFQRQG